jgi:hypothetical protein
MKKFIVLSALLTFIVAASQVSAETSIHCAITPGENTAPAEKFAVDVFGNYNVKHDIFGGGVGLSYFFDRYIGVGASVQRDGADGKFSDGLFIDASLILRYPIDQWKVTPYAFAGAGRSTEVNDWGAHVGIGLEVGVFHHVNVFTDYRQIFRQSYVNDGNIRLGLRFGF